MGAQWHFNLRDKTQGISRELADGIAARIFGGEKMTVSVVELDSGAVSPAHHHVQEQWGFLIQGSIERILGDERIEMEPGDFWQTPGGVPHGMVAGPEGAIVIDVFAPPRQEYLKPGAGYGAGATANGTGG